MVTDLWIERVQRLDSRERALRERAACMLDEANKVADRRRVLLLKPEDRVVLVRRSMRATRSTYHNSNGPCGYAFARGFERLLESEADMGGLRRCGSCHWPAASGALK